MSKLLGRAEYLSDEEIKKSRLIGSESGPFWIMKEAREEFSYPLDVMMSAFAGTGKTYFVKKKMSKGMKANYCMLDKQTLEYDVQDNSADITILDDFNYLFEAARYSELNDLEFDTKEAFETISSIYDEAKENDRSVLLISTEGIWSLSTLLKPEIRQPFVKKFAWALDARETPTDIMLKYHKQVTDKLEQMYYNKTGRRGMGSYYVGRTHDFRKELIINPEYRSWSGIEKEIKDMEKVPKWLSCLNIQNFNQYDQLLIREQFNLIDLPPVIPAYNAYYGHKPKIIFGKYNKIIMDADGNNLIFNDGSKKDITFGGDQPKSYRIVWKMIELPRKLEVIKQSCGEISAQTLDIKPKFAKKIKENGEVLWPRFKAIGEASKVIWRGDEINDAIRRINQVFREKTMTVDWYQLVNDIIASDTHEAVQGAFLRYDLSKQVP